MDFLEDFSSSGQLNLLDADGNPLEISRAITAVRKVTIAAKSSTTTEVQTTRGARSSMEEVEAHAADHLPSIMRFFGAIFTGTDDRLISARLSVLTSSDTPMFSLRIMEWDAHLVSLAEEIERRLSDELSAQIYVGASTFPG